MKTSGGSISRPARFSLAAAAGVIIAGWFGAVALAAGGSGPPNPDTLYERAPVSSDDAMTPDESAAPPSPAAAAATAPAAPAPAPTAAEPAVESMGAGGGDASTIIVPDSMPAPRIVNQDGAVPPSTTVIPEATGALPGDTADQNQVVNYEAQQNPQLIDPQLHSMQEFMEEEGSETSPLGIEVQEDQRKLADGEIADGLLVVGVVPGSPAASAGLHPFRQTARNIIEGTAIAAALVFPPAVVVVPIIESVNFHESYDLIIGVDGVRVTNFLDFDDRMRAVQPGEIVYLSLVRNGRRVQLPVPVRSLLKPPGF
jgi:hypothetical protein